MLVILLSAVPVYLAQRLTEGAATGTRGANAQATAQAATPAVP